MFFPFIYKVLTSFSGFLFSGEPGIYVSPRFQGKPAFKKAVNEQTNPERTPGRGRQSNILRRFVIRGGRFTASSR
jgi:hypothetical protein